MSRWTRCLLQVSPASPQVKEDPRGTVDIVARDKRRSNQSSQSNVFLGPIRHGLQQPLVMAALRHFEHAAHHLDAVLVSMRFDELVRRADSARNLVLGFCDRAFAKSRILASPLNPTNSTLSILVSVGRGPLEPEKFSQITSVGEKSIDRWRPINASPSLSSWPHQNFHVTQLEAMLSYIAVLFNARLVETIGVSRTFTEPSNSMRRRRRRAE